jgi:hypothetical protein
MTFQPPVNSAVYLRNTGPCPHRYVENKVRVTHFRKFVLTWPPRLRRRSAAERFLGSWVRIPPWAWMFSLVQCLCCQVEISATG